MDNKRDPQRRVLPPLPPPLDSPPPRAMPTHTPPRPAARAPINPVNTSKRKSKPEGRRRGSATKSRVSTQSALDDYYSYSGYYDAKPAHQDFRSRTATWYRDNAEIVSANYRFVLSPDPLLSHLANAPDEPIPWALVQQVLALPQQAGPCPICLVEPATAPRMARCGHIMCLTCSLKLFASDPEAKSLHRSCPQCADRIHPKDLKPVRFIETNASDHPRPGADVRLRLMAWKSPCSVTFPADTPLQDVLPAVEDAECILTSRLLRGSPQYICTQLEHDISRIKAVAEADLVLYPDLDTTFWADKAVANVEAAIAEQATIEQIENLMVNNSGNMPESMVYFYQPKDGSRCFLSNIDLKVLKSEFQDYSKFPTSLLVRVQHVSSGHIVTEEMRSHRRDLRNLPLGAEISFLECDWRGIVSPETLKLHEKELIKRVKLRREKERREDRQRARWLAAEESKNRSEVQINEMSFSSLSLDNSDLELALELSKENIGGAGGGGSSVASRPHMPPVAFSDVARNGSSAVPEWYAPPGTYEVPEYNDLLFGEDTQPPVVETKMRKGRKQKRVVLMSTGGGRL
ncbi:hypothetical protein CANCADRAFT_146451 [Tortispora caseinolytica NRRL Y-17796]|uniref:RING-type domain-containing protein n=1 Tax=Tortispora caseinolytica NRRL Y-17796 TaxID=767744 RepID=A0A1E4T9L6_9ASCO|nr:hypothetical protein CANCADRAFT_146451 [Tortispora caseinolytica NRRL Y-17796]